MYLDQFISIAIIHLVAVLSPGPDFTIVLRQSVVSGRKQAVFTSIGIGVGILFHILYCVIGIDFISSSNNYILYIIKYLGASYLMYIGFKSILSKKINIKIANKNDIKNKIYSYRKSFTLGFLTNILNPKASLFFLSLFSIIIDYNTPLSLQLLYGLWMSIITAIWFCLLSFLTTVKISKIFISKYALLIDKIMGVVLVIISIKLILQ